MCDVEVTVVGAGIVGCAVAARLAVAGHPTVLLDMEEDVARETTSRNSEVVHGGMYYPTGTLKARFCVEGRRLLKNFCLEAGVGFRECGKLIVALGEDEVPELERLRNLGTANGVEDLRLLDGAELKRLEPGITAHAGLFSPRTGILDAEEAARAFARQATEHGAQVMTGARVTGLDREGEGWRVTVMPTDGRRREGWSHTSRIVVNASGLWADRVAALAGIDIVEREWRLHLTRGNYFAIANRHDGRVDHLVYPVPPADGTTLGVHVCLDLAGQMKLGPDLEHLPADPRDAVAGPADFALDYHVDPARGRTFFEDARKFLPWLEEGDLTPAMSGLRPKLVPTGFRDFVIAREDEPFAGLVNLVGIESPGLTSSPAIAAHVGGLVREMLS